MRSLTCRSFRRGIICVALLAGSNVAAGPTPDPITGHYYEEVATFLTWDAARVDAAGRVFGSAGGHLATIATMNENLIVQHLGGLAERWIGLTDSTSVSSLDGTDLSLLGTFEAGNTSGLPLPPPGTMPGPGQRGAGFRWVTGEPYTFLNWRSGAPGDFQGQADGVYAIVQGVWQDAAAGATLGQPGPGGPTTRRHTVEYDVDRMQSRFHIRERLAASSFNSGTGHVATTALADELLALPINHPDVARHESNQAYVVSFHDPDLGGGYDSYVRHPFLADVVGTNDEVDFAYSATARVMIPTAGDWTFAIMAGDRFRLRVGGNEFSADGVMATGPARLTRPADGTLSAVPGGSGSAFYFPVAGVYSLNLTAIERDFSAFQQLFAVSGVATVFDPAAFDLVGDELNGGPVLVEASGGDFDADGDFDCADVDALVGEIATAGTDLAFDLTGDGLITAADLVTWRTLAGAANLPNGGAFLVGDANLDGVVDGSDFGIWNANKFTTAAAWCRGDFSADGVVDGSDFGLWNANKFTSSDAPMAVIPEPGVLAGLALQSACVATVLLRRGRGCRRSAP